MIEWARGKLFCELSIYKYSKLRLIVIVWKRFKRKVLINGLKIKPKIKAQFFCF